MLIFKDIVLTKYNVSLPDSADVVDGTDIELGFRLWPKNVLSRQPIDFTKPVSITISQTKAQKEQ